MTPLNDPGGPCIPCRRSGNARTCGERTYPGGLNKVAEGNIINRMGSLMKWLKEPITKQFLEALQGEQNRAKENTNPLNPPSFAQYPSSTSLQETPFSAAQEPVLNLLDRSSLSQNFPSAVSFPYPGTSKQDPPIPVLPFNGVVHRTDEPVDSSLNEDTTQARVIALLASSFPLADPANVASIVSKAIATLSENAIPQGIRLSTRQQADTSDDVYDILRISHYT